MSPVAALIILCAFGALSIASAAAYIGGYKSSTKIGGGTLLLGIVMGGIESALAFYLATQTGSILVLVAAWITLIFNINGIARLGFWQNKIYAPSDGYLVLMATLNLATIIMFIAGYMSTA